MARDGGAAGIQVGDWPESEGSTLVWDAPGLGVGTAQHHGEKLLGIPLALLEQGGVSAPSSGAGPQPMPGVTE